MQKKDLKSLVVFSNEWLRSEYYSRPELDLSMTQKKLIFFLMSKVDREAKQFEPEEINIRDYCQLFGINIAHSGTNRKKFIQSLIELKGKSVAFQKADGGIRLVSWLDYIDIYPGRGIIVFKLADRLSEYFQQLSKQFTQTQLLYLAQFKSKYAADLYLLCKAHCFKHDFYLAYQDVREFLMHGDSERYPRYFDFAKRILTPAIEAINENSDINVIVRPMKEKNRITNLAFRVWDKKREDLKKLKVQQIFNSPARKDELKEMMGDVLGGNDGNNPRWTDADADAMYDCAGTMVQLGSTGDEEFIKIFREDVTEEC